MTTPLLTGPEYLALPAPAETFIVTPLLPVGGAMLIYGDPKIGKSYAALQMAVAISQGHDWLGFPTKRSRVAYFQLDTPRSLWRNRLEELKRSGVPVDSVHYGDRDTLNAWPFDILAEEHFSRLASSIAEVKPEVVIIDTLKESHQLDENDATSSQKVIARLVGATQPAALILVHHARKLNPERPNDLINGSRGSGYLVGRMDAIIHFSRRSMSYVSRSIEEGSIRLERADNGFWLPVDTEVDSHVVAVMHMPGSVRDRARELAIRTGKTEEAARSIIRRALRKT